MTVQRISPRYAQAAIVLMGAATMAGCAARSTNASAASSSATATTSASSGPVSSASATGPAPCQQDGLPFGDFAIPSQPDDGYKATDIFTNKGSVDCTMSGFPAISLVTDASKSFGSSAVADSTEHPVTTLRLKPGQSAGYDLKVIYASSVVSKDCTPQNRISKYDTAPPENTKTITITITTQTLACATANAPKLTVSAMYSVPTPPAITPAG